MYHITDIQEKGNEILRRDIFPSIISGNTILFLGAGASITDNKVYLSSQLMNYHKAESGIVIKLTVLLIMSMYSAEILN